MSKGLHQATGTKSSSDSPHVKTRNDYDSTWWRMAKPMALHNRGTRHTNAICNLWRGVDVTLWFIIRNKCFGFCPWFLAHSSPNPSNFPMRVIGPSFLIIVGFCPHSWNSLRVIGGENGHLLLFITSPFQSHLGLRELNYFWKVSLIHLRVETGCQNKPIIRELALYCPSPYRGGRGLGGWIDHQWPTI